MTPPKDLDCLKQFSTQIGINPFLIQAAGGNTSLKEDGIMWIKASGTQLKDANNKNIFVATNVKKIQMALANNLDAADNTAQFITAGYLKPSIETSLHAVFPQRIVIHVHCVNTIAIAIQKNAKLLLADRLVGINWAFVAYYKPGAKLARAVAQVRKNDTNVVVLGNHGLLIAADSVAKARALMTKVIVKISQPIAMPAAVDKEALQAYAGDGYTAGASNNPLHQIALSHERLRYAMGGSLYPDHVIFCGIGVITLSKGETPRQAVTRHPNNQKIKPPFLFVADCGALINQTASSSALALSQCLADVLLRLPNGATLNYLTEKDNAELLDWDAEKYRMKMNAS